MNVVESEQVYMFDVDDTLILWDDKCLQGSEGKIAIVDPYDSKIVFLRPHTRHVKLLTQMFGRGRHIIVWSAGGYKWAVAVIEALGLEDKVHLVMTKPAGYVDDLECSKWLTNRIYLKPEAAE